MRDSTRRGWPRKWSHGDGGGWSVQSGVSVGISGGGTAGQALAGEGERKHDGEYGEDNSITESKRLRKKFGDDGDEWSVQSGMSVPLCRVHDGKKKAELS